MPSRDTPDAEETFDSEKENKNRADRHDEVSSEDPEAEEGDAAKQFKVECCLLIPLASLCVDAYRKL
jgi:hypothetical protein